MIAGEDIEGGGAVEMEVSEGEETRSQESEPHRETEAVGHESGHQAGQEQGGLEEVTQVEDRALGDTDRGVMGSSGDPGTEPSETVLEDQDGSSDRVEEVVETDEVLGFYLGELLFWDIF